MSDRAARPVHGLPRLQALLTAVGSKAALPAVEGEREKKPALPPLPAPRPSTEPPAARQPIASGTNVIPFVAPRRLPPGPSVRARHRPADGTVSTPATQVETRTPRVEGSSAVALPKPPPIPVRVDKKIAAAAPAVKPAKRVESPVATPVAKRAKPAETPVELPVDTEVVPIQPPIEVRREPIPAPPAPQPANDVSAPQAPEAPAPAANPWAVYEQLGLGAPVSPATSVQTTRFLVSAYRALGFVVLTVIVAVLVGYLATSVFYFVSTRWIQPVSVSPNDERVLGPQAQVTEQQNVRDRIVADLNHADRTIALHQTFQAEFARAIRADLEGRRGALASARKLADSYAAARGRIQRSNRAFASSSSRRMAQEYAAGLIDRGDMLAGKYQLAQISGATLSLSERQAEYSERAAALEAEAQALEAILSRKGGDGALSYQVLKVKQEYEMSRLETAKAVENREVLKASLIRQDKVIAGLRQSPYLRAIEDAADVAFVPYSNMENVELGAPVYRCALEMVLCREVGKVTEILPGEVSFEHPHRERVLRGKMVKIDLDDQSAAEKDVLFVGRRPLLI